MVSPYREDGSGENARRSAADDHLDGDPAPHAAQRELEYQREQPGRTRRPLQVSSLRPLPKTRDDLPLIALGRQDARQSNAPCLEQEPPSDSCWLVL